MNTRNIFSLLICIALFFAACNNIGSSVDDAAIPQLLERKNAPGPVDEQQSITSTYNKAVKALKENPIDTKQYLNIATAFVLEGRVTGNGSYYSNAAMKMLKRVTEETSNKDMLFQAWSLESTVLLNMHQFKDAKEAAQKGVAISEFNSGIWGALVDANVELGKYGEAVKDCDKMLGIRPDIRSYSRASYLRQIYGDNNGAVEAMKLAVAAGVPGTESAEWARVILGDLYLNKGMLDSAQFNYEQSLLFRPGYAFAEIGLAKTDKAKKNYDAAIVHTRNAIKTMGEAAFVTYLGDLYELKGDNVKSKEIRNDVVRLLEEAEKNQPKDAPIKHNANRELAIAYMNINELDKALQYAKKDLSMRPENIDANELAGWIYFHKGDYADAKTCADKMLRLQTKNSDMLYKASVIYAAAGDAAKASECKKLSLTVSPYVDQRLLLATK